MDESLNQKQSGNFFSKLAIVSMILAGVSAFALLYSDSPCMVLALHGHFTCENPLLPQYVNIISSIVMSVSAFLFVSEMMK